MGEINFRFRRNKSTLQIETTGREEEWKMEEEKEQEQEQALRREDMGEFQFLLSTTTTGTSSLNEGEDKHVLRDTAKGKVIADLPR